MATGELDGGFSRLLSSEKTLLGDVVHSAGSNSEGRLDQEISIPVCSRPVGGNHHALLIVRIEEEHLEHGFPKLSGLSSPVGHSEEALAQQPAKTDPVQHRRSLENELEEPRRTSHDVQG
jgi:hypothetical protein